LKPNNFPLREWHIEHMEKTIITFVEGLSDNATKWETKKFKRYGKITSVCRQIEYDIKHGVTREQVLSILQQIRNNSSFSTLLNNDGSVQRLRAIEKYFAAPKERNYWMSFRSVYGYR
jgi:hypothetical protein